MALTAPIKDTNDIKKMAKWLKNNVDEAFTLLFNVGTCTGYRITDLTELKWADISFDEGTVTLKENKGTRAAISRAKAKVIREVKAEQISIAMMNRTDNAIDILQLLHGATDTEAMEKAIFSVVDKGNAKIIQARIDKAMKSAKPKYRTADLSKAVLIKLRKRFEKFGAIDDGNVFSRNTFDSNRAKNTEGVISRQSCHRVFKAAGQAISTAINIIKGSCHGSLRKTYARLLYTQNGNDLGETISQMGWSSATMALKYLGFDTETRKRSSANVHAAL